MFTRGRAAALISALVLTSCSSSEALPSSTLRTLDVDAADGASALAVLDDGRLAIGGRATGRILAADPTGEGAITELAG